MKKILFLCMNILLFTSIEISSMDSLNPEQFHQEIRVRLYFREFLRRTLELHHDENTIETKKETLQKIKVFYEEFRILKNIYKNFDIQSYIQTYLKGNPDLSDTPTQKLTSREKNPLFEKFLLDIQESIQDVHSMYEASAFIEDHKDAYISILSCIETIPHIQRGYNSP